MKKQPLYNNQWFPVREIYISKRFFVLLVRFLLFFFIVFAIIIHFSEFEYQKLKVKRVVEKETREYRSSYNSQKRTFDECSNWCKNNPPPQRRLNPNYNYNNFDRVPIYITDEESAYNKLKRLTCGCPEKNYIGNRYYPTSNFFIYKPSTSPKYYGLGDFYIKSVKIIPFFGNSYKYTYKNEKFLLTHYVSKIHKWNYINRLRFYFFGILYNLHLIILASFFGVIVIYILKYLKNNFKIRLKD